MNDASPPTDERSAFEAWCPTAGIVDWSRTHGDDNYTRPRTQFAWEVWQAARQSHEPPAQHELEAWRRAYPNTRWCGARGCLVIEQVIDARSVTGALDQVMALEQSTTKEGGL